MFKRKGKQTMKPKRILAMLITFAMLLALCPLTVAGVSNTTSKTVDGFYLTGPGAYKLSYVTLTITGVSVSGTTATVNVNWK